MLGVHWGDGARVQWEVLRAELPQISNVKTEYFYIDTVIKKVTLQNTRMKTLPIFLLSFILCSCVTTTQYVPLSASNEVAADSTRIVILRKSPLGTAIKANVLQDGKLMGKTGPRGYLAWSAPADGNLSEIVSKTENRERITIPFLPGKTYYVRQRVAFGWLISRFKLQLVSPEEGEKLMKKLKKPVVVIPAVVKESASGKR
jgi:hypothetical protein